MQRHIVPLLAAMLGLGACDTASAPSPTDDLVQRSHAAVPTPGPDGWGEGDELGNGNTQSYGTRLRCAGRMLDPDAKVYELSYELSDTMPQSIFAEQALSLEHTPTLALPFFSQLANATNVSGTLGQQGTQMDALGHFAILPEPWNPGVDPEPPVEDGVYYNGFTQAQVKPTADSGLLALGMEKAPPIITSAVILDMVDLLGRPMDAGELITPQMIDDAIHAQGLSWRGILPGDAVYIRTGYGQLWSDPDTTGYYIGGPDQGTPGLSYDAVQRLAEDFPVLVALDNPFTDAFRLCLLDGSCTAPDTTLPGVPFPAHHSHLVEHGIYQIQNLNLAEIADDDVDVACTMVLPLRVRGAAGSPVRPIAVGG